MLTNMLIPLMVEETNQVKMKAKITDFTKCCRTGERQRF